MIILIIENMLSNLGLNIKATQYNIWSIVITYIQKTALAP